MSDTTETKEIAAATPSKPARHTDEEIRAASLDTAGALPSLNGSVEHFTPLSISYWSPETPGEYKDCFVFGVGDADIQDFETKETKSVECVFILEQTPDNHLVRWYSASRILVGTVKSAISRSEIIQATYLTPVRIIYKGLKRTKTGKNAADWQVMRLIVADQE
jgi:hypothetical protein